MALPIIAGLAIATAAGAATAKGTSKAREYFNDGETVRCKCPRCENRGPHKFSRIDRSAAAGATLGFLAGPLAGAAGGVLAKRVFKCRRCGGELYENGKKPTWNAGKAIDAFIHYPALQEDAEELRRVIAMHRTVAQKRAAKIERLERDLADSKADQERLRKRIRALIRVIKREAA